MTVVVMRASSPPLVARPGSLSAVRICARCVIFDCDGVLVDSERISVEIDQVVLARAGITMTVEEIVDRFVGRSGAVMDDFIEERLGHPLSVELKAEADALHYRAYEHDLAPVGGIEEALAELRHPVCVASSSALPILRRKLELTGLLAHFGEHVYSASQVARGKPAPDLFLFAAERMGFDPGDCVVVEDSQYGVDAALAAGMAVLAYAGGVTPARSLEREGAILFEDMRALPAMIEAPTGA